jgi:Flp pilus assembly protein TadG
MDPHPRTARRHARVRLGDERGGASAELVLCVPLVMLLILGIVQFALLAHAQHIAQSAAAQGLAAARAQHGSTTAGQAAADNTLAALGTGVLSAPAVHVDRGTDQADVTVQGHAETIIPGVRLTVTAHVAGPVEHWTVEAGGSP